MSLDQKEDRPVLDTDQFSTDQTVAFGAGLRHRVREHATQPGASAS
jgi:hypothetical protein